jgi:hypothetical protein
MSIHRPPLTRRHKKHMRPRCLHCSQTGHTSLVTRQHSLMLRVLSTVNAQAAQRAGSHLAACTASPPCARCLPARCAACAFTTLRTSSVRGYGRAAGREQRNKRPRILSHTPCSGSCHGTGMPAHAQPPLARRQRRRAPGARPVRRCEHAHCLPPLWWRPCTCHAQGAPLGLSDALIMYVPHGTGRAVCKRTARGTRRRSLRNHRTLRPSCVATARPAYSEQPLALHAVRWVTHARLNGHQSGQLQASACRRAREKTRHAASANKAPLTQSRIGNTMPGSAACIRTLLGAAARGGGLDPTVAGACATRSCAPRMRVHV